MRFNRIICGDSEKELSDIPDKVINLILTSPPYDGANMRGRKTLNINRVGWELYRVLSDNGVCVIVIQDKFVNGGKSMTSFSTAVYWVKEIGFNLWADYIYVRGGTEGYWWKSRPRQDHDYVFVFAKGRKPKSFNKEHMMEKSGKSIICKGTVLDYKSEKKRSRIKGKGDKEWPVPFPLKLALDMIMCYSVNGDTVLDPFCGNGTTLLAAKRLNRNYLGIEIFEDVAKYARDQLERGFLA